MLAVASPIQLVVSPPPSVSNLGNSDAFAPPNLEAPSLLPPFPFPFLPYLHSTTKLFFWVGGRRRRRGYKLSKSGEEEGEGEGQGSLFLCGRGEGGGG